MKGGYCGRVLFVDLSQRKIEELNPPEQTYRRFIGGTGLGVRFLYEKMKAGSDPLGSENILGFVTGPLTGTSAPGSGRFTVVCKSPLTNAWADSNSGGYWGRSLNMLDTMLCSSKVWQKSRYTFISLKVKQS